MSMESKNKVGESSEIPLNINESREPMSRYTASEILKKVAKAGEYGGNPNIDPYEIGKALFRILSNNGASDKYNLDSLMKGYIGETSFESD